MQLKDRAIGVSIWPGPGKHWEWHCEDCDKWSPHVHPHQAGVLISAAKHNAAAHGKAEYRIQIKESRS